jgi:hypothetical protein
MSSGGFLMGAVMLCVGACASSSTSSARADIPKAADCPGGRVVSVINATNEGINVLTPMYTDRAEVLGVRRTVQVQVRCA